MRRVRLRHNDYPESLVRDLRQKFGDDLVVETAGENEVVISIDDRGTRWNRSFAVEDEIKRFLEENKWVHDADFIG